MPDLPEGIVSVKLKFEGGTETRKVSVARGQTTQVNFEPKARGWGLFAVGLAGVTVGVPVMAGGSYLDHGSSQTAGVIMLVAGGVVLAGSVALGIYGLVKKPVLPAAMTSSVVRSMDQGAPGLVLRF